MMLTVAISCVNDYVSGYLHQSKVVHERGKRNQTQMACYIYFSGKGQTVATVEQVRCSVVEQVRMFGGRTSSDVLWSNKLGCSVVEQVR
jgi:hypothetical protein